MGIPGDLGDLVRLGPFAVPGGISVVFGLVAWRRRRRTAAASLDPTSDGSVPASEVASSRVAVRAVVPSAVVAKWWTLIGIVLDTVCVLLDIALSVARFGRALGRIALWAGMCVEAGIARWSPGSSADRRGAVDTLGANFRARLTGVDSSTSPGDAETGLEGAAPVEVTVPKQPSGVPAPAVTS